MGLKSDGAGEITLTKMKSSSPVLRIPWHCPGLETITSPAWISSSSQGSGKNTPLPWRQIQMSSDAEWSWA